MVSMSMHLRMLKIRKDIGKKMQICFSLLRPLQLPRAGATQPPYGDSLAIFERLAKADPGNVEWQRDLSVAYGKIGDVQRAHGDLAAVLKSYADSLAIAEKLTKTDPGNVDWQRDLWVCYARLGDAHRKSSEPAKARDAMTTGRAIVAKLVEEHPDWAKWKQDLAWFDEQIAEWKKGAPQRNDSLLHEKQKQNGRWSFMANVWRKSGGCTGEI